MLCKACGIQGHRAFFCPFRSAPNLDYKDSGHRAYQELPEDTVRAHELQLQIQEAFEQIFTDSSPSAVRGALNRLTSSSFSLGWRYACWKKHYNVTSHAAEPQAKIPIESHSASDSQQQDNPHMSIA